MRFFGKGAYNRWAEATTLLCCIRSLRRDSSILRAAGIEWGYSGSDYFVRSGPQMRAVKAMIDRIVGK